MLQLKLALVIATGLQLVLVSSDIVVFGCDACCPLTIRVLRSPAQPYHRNTGAGVMVSSMSGNSTYLNTILDVCYLPAILGVNAVFVLYLLDTRRVKKRIADNLLPIFIYILQVNIQISRISALRLRLILKPLDQIRCRITQEPCVQQFECIQYLLRIQYSVSKQI